MLYLNKLLMYVEIKQPCKNANSSNHQTTSNNKQSIKIVKLTINQKSTLQMSTCVFLLEGNQQLETTKVITKSEPWRSKHGATAPAPKAISASKVVATVALGMTLHGARRHFFRWFRNMVFGQKKKMAWLDSIKSGSDLNLSIPKPWQWKIGTRLMVVVDGCLHVLATSMYSWTSVNVSPVFFHDNQGIGNIPFQATPRILGKGTE